AESLSLGGRAFVCFARLKSCGCLGRSEQRVDHLFEHDAPHAQDAHERIGPGIHEVDLLFASHDATRLAPTRDSTVASALESFAGLRSRWSRRSSSHRCTSAVLATTSRRSFAVANFFARAAIR